MIYWPREVICVTVWEVLAVLVIAVAAMWVADRTGEGAYHRAYNRAMRQDMEYYRTHPDCTLAEAHQYRDAVNRRFHR